MGDHCIACNSRTSFRPLYPISPKRAVVKAVNTKENNLWKVTGVLLLRKLHARYQNCQLFHQLYITERTVRAKDILLTKRFREFLYVLIYKSSTGFPKRKIPHNVQGGSNMTGTDLYVNKPHCAAAVRPGESEAATSTLPPARVRTCSVLSGSC